MSRKRPDWDELYMTSVLIRAFRSACLYHHVGVAFVDVSHREICGGYNGPLAGDPNCCEVGCLKVDGDPETGEKGECRGLHAEDNAINSYPGEKSRFEGATLYTTLEPCLDCTKILTLLGVKRVVFLKKYSRVTSEGRRESNSAARKFARDHGIKWDRYKGDFVNPWEVLHDLQKLAEGGRG